MRIAYNPIDCNPLSFLENNDITFDLSGRNIFVKGVKFSGVDDLVSKVSPGWVPIIKDSKQDITNDFYLLTSDGNNAYWNKFPELFFDKYKIEGDFDDGYKISLTSLSKNDSNVTIPFMVGANDTQSGSPGLIPAPDKGGLRYLDSKGIWSTPSDMLVMNTLTTTETFYITGSVSNKTNTSTQVFNTKNYINSTEGIYSNGSLVINQNDPQTIVGVKNFINSPIIGGTNIVQWDKNGNYILTYENTTDWNKSIIVNQKDSTNKQFFGWEGEGDSSGFAYLGLNVSNYLQSQYRFDSENMYINNKKVITESNITNFIDDKYVNIEGDIMSGPLVVQIRDYGISLGISDNGGNLQLGNFSDSGKAQNGSITGFNESTMQQLLLKSDLVKSEGSFISGNFISTFGKTKNNDITQGILLEKDTITINGESPKINFHYNGSARSTSSITETDRGELSINAITRILGGSYFGEKYYFNAEGEIKADKINVDNNLEVLGNTILNTQYVNSITYNINQEQDIDISSVFVTKLDRNKESNVITKISIDEFAFSLVNRGSISISKSLQITTDWTDTGITELTEPGTYIVQIQDSSKRLYSGVMSWSTKSSSIGEEILLHRAGSNTSNTIYLRTLGTSIQIAGSTNTSSTFTFNFKKMI